MKQTWKIGNDTQRLIREQYKQGMSKNQLAKLYSVTWSTINNIVIKAENNHLIRCYELNLDWVKANIIDTNPGAYCYVLGMYLGDGYINEMHREGVFRLRISLDNQYPEIIEECHTQLMQLLPDNKVTIVKYNNSNVCDVSCYSKLLPILFPQHGKGLKTDRDVSLTDWQIGYVNQHPKAFLKGLIRSDGCRYTNTVKVKGKIYQYPSYGFTNTSKDIINAFLYVCNLLNLQCVASWGKSKQPNHHDRCSVTITKRKDVEFLDEFMYN